ncbi:MAG: site-2 protease family protein [Candidatus Woesearchaeota archaeon]
MSVDGIAAIIFVILLGLFLWKKRNQVHLQKALFPILYVVMYKSSFGLRSMERISKKFPRMLRLLADIAVILGFIGMVFICAQLLLVTVEVFTKPGGIPGIQPVLPIEAKGVFFVPFLYWILSIFLLALFHEFAHGVVARVYNIPVRSSGFAFLCIVLPVIPAAFVEPDEKVVQRRSYRQQLGVFAAGPIANMLFAAAMIGVFFLVSPILSSAFEPQGVEVVKITPGGPAALAGIKEGDIITYIDNVQVSSVENMTAILKQAAPGDHLLFQTSASYAVTLGENPQNASKAFLGVQTRTHLVPKEVFVERYGAWLPLLLKWVAGLIFWLFMLNVGIGLFNLLPIGPLDGGRMFQLVCFKLFKNKSTAVRVWAFVSVFFVAIILANMLVGFFR